MKERSGQNYKAHLQKNPEGDQAHQILYYLNGATGQKQGQVEQRTRVDNPEIKPTHIKKTAQGCLGGSVG